MRRSRIPVSLGVDCHGVVDGGHNNIKRLCVMQSRVGVVGNLHGDISSTVLI